MPSKEDMLKAVGEMLQNNWNMLTNSLKKETKETIESDGSIDDHCKLEFEKLKNEFRDIKENQVRDLAYSLWEDSGRPEGCSDEFWRRAEESLNV